MREQERKQSENQPRPLSSASEMPFLIAVSFCNFTLHLIRRKNTKGSNLQFAIYSKKSKEGKLKSHAFRFSANNRAFPFHFIFSFFSLSRNPFWAHSLFLLKWTLASFFVKFPLLGHSPGPDYFVKVFYLKRGFLPVFPTFLPAPPNFSKSLDWPSNFLPNIIENYTD